MKTTIEKNRSFLACMAKLKKGPRNHRRELRKLIMQYVRLLTNNDTVSRIVTDLYVATFNLRWCSAEEYEIDPHSISLAPTKRAKGVVRSAIFHLDEHLHDNNNRQSPKDTYDYLSGEIEETPQFKAFVQRENKKLKRFGDLADKVSLSIYERKETVWENYLWDIEIE